MEAIQVAVEAGAGFQRSGSETLELLCFSSHFKLLLRLQEVSDRMELSPRTVDALRMVSVNPPSRVDQVQVVRHTPGEVGFSKPVTRKEYYGAVRAVQHLQFCDPRCAYSYFIHNAQRLNCERLLVANGPLLWRVGKDWCLFALGFDCVGPALGTEVDSPGVLYHPEDVFLWQLR